MFVDDQVMRQAAQSMAAIDAVANSSTYDADVAEVHHVSTACSPIMESGFKLVNIGGEHTEMCVMNTGCSEKTS